MRNLKKDADNNKEAVTFFIQQLEMSIGKDVEKFDINSIFIESENIPLLLIAYTNNLVVEKNFSLHDTK